MFLDCLSLSDEPCVEKPIVVLKFGGSSVKTVGRMQHVAEVIQSFCNGERGVVVVVSAMGDTTDHLLGLAGTCTDEPDKRELDVLLATGEQVSVSLLSIILKKIGLKAKSLVGQQIGLLTEAKHGQANIVAFEPSVLRQAIEENDVVVVAGFQGVTADGDITTLGRGGSDTSAVALAAGLHADECHIFTDVDGIFDCDPNKFANATFISRISYEHCLRLAQAGAQVMHDRAVALGRRHGVRIRVRNTFKPQHSGTLICDESEVDTGRAEELIAV